MSDDLKVKTGDPVKADQWNRVVDRLPRPKQGKVADFTGKIVHCYVTEEIDPAEEATDPADSVYYGGLVNTYGMMDNEDGTFSPVLTTRNAILINPSPNEPIPVGTKLWAHETYGGYLVATVWPCEVV